MAFFDKPDPLNAPELPPLSHDRLVERLVEHGVAFGVDEDGDPGARWDDHLFFLLRLGENREYLQVRGRWVGNLRATLLGEVLSALNEWNTERIWPKAYVRVEDDHLGVYCEHTVDYALGLTDGQLDLHLGCGVSTALGLFALLDAAYPEAAAAARAALHQDGTR